MRPRHRWCALVAALLFACGSASAEVGLRGWGPRVGLSDEPDQFLAGAHWDLGEFAPHWRFQPSVDFGFGDDVRSFSGNAMSAYYFPVERSSVIPYAGGQVTASWFDFDLPGGNSDSKTEVGLAAVGGIETRLKSGNRFLAEIQIGMGDVADFKVFAGWTF